MTKVSIEAGFHRYPSTNIRPKFVSLFKQILNVSVSDNGIQLAKPLNAVK
jgi:hypothetical protein